MFACSRLFWGQTLGCIHESLIFFPYLHCCGKCTCNCMEDSNDADALLKQWLWWVQSVLSALTVNSTSACPICCICPTPKTIKNATASPTLCSQVPRVSLLPGSLVFADVIPIREIISSSNYVAVLWVSIWLPIVALPLKADVAASVPPGVRCRPGLQSEDKLSHIVLHEAQRIKRLYQENQ